MAAVGVMIIAALLTPGVSLIDPVDQTDFSSALNSLGENPNLGHLATLLAMVAMLLYARGFLGIYRSIAGESGFAATLLRIGIGTSLFGWGLFTTGMGMRHMAIHLTQRAAEEPAMAESIIAGAGGVFVAMTAVLIAFLAVYPIATCLTGVGLAMRFASVGLQTIVAWGLAIAGLLAFAVFQTALHVPSFDPGIMLQTNNAALSLGTLLLFLLGLGIFRGKSTETD
jgi:hypothetical protein